MKTIYRFMHIPSQTAYFGATSKTQTVNTATGVQPFQLTVLFAALRSNRHANPKLQAAWTGDEADWSFEYLGSVLEGESALKVVEDYAAKAPRTFNMPKRPKETRHQALKHGADKFPPEVRAEVLDLLGQGYTGVEISGMTGLSQGTVSNIRNMAGLGRGKRFVIPKETV